jgi:hypothetical protein
MGGVKLHVDMSATATVALPPTKDSTRIAGESVHRKDPYQWT